MQISEIRQKIIRKNGREAIFIKLIVIARVFGYESSDPIEEVADKLGIKVLKIKKYKVIFKDDLNKLLQSLINSFNTRNVNNTNNVNNSFDANNNFV